MKEDKGEWALIILAGVVGLAFYFWGDVLNDVIAKAVHDFIIAQREGG